VTNGFVSILLDGINQRIPVVNGAFTMTINRCSNTAAAAKLLAVDLEGNEQGTIQTVHVTQGNIPPVTVNACGVSVAEYINITINGNMFSLVEPGDSIFARRDNNQFEVFASSVWNATVKRADFKFSGAATPGTYPLDYVGISAAGRFYTLQSPTNTTVTAYGDVNGFVSGSFSGNLTDSLNGNLSVPVSCTYRVKRL
jgi:hypothetical protein